MPLILEFPAKHPKPEKGLSNLLKKHEIHDFGNFGMWYAPVLLGFKKNWISYDIQAKVDTGATISLFPEFIAVELGMDTGIPYELYGVVRKRVCIVEVQLRKVNMQIKDINNNSLILEDIWVAFTNLERVPVLLGYKDVLERLIIGQKPGTDVLTLQKRNVEK